MGFKTKNGVLLKYEEVGTLERLGIRKAGETVSVPKSVNRIEDEAFTMTNVNSVSLPSSVQSIGEKAFALCADLESIEIASGLREIGPNAFDGCHLLRGITLPDTVQTVGIWAFCNCCALKNVKLSETLESIPRGMFSGCLCLEEITVPASVQHIDTRAFYACTSLETVTLSAGLRSIGREAFAGCAVLKQIYIPETVTEICEDAFAGCEELKTVIIPPSVTKLHPYAFGNNSNVRVITTTTGSVAYQFALEHGIMCYTEKEAAQLRGVNPAFYIEYGILRKYVQEFNVRDVMIPDGVIRVGNHAFEQNRQIFSVVIPEGVMEIGSYAFNGCRNLQRVYFPSTLKKIERFAFRDCPIIEAILPEGMEVIEKNAFQSCTALRRFYMPDTVTKIETEALQDCMSLTELRFSAKLEMIPDAVCGGCSSLRTVVIPEGPKYIQQNAFRGCSSLREAYVPDSILEISGNAFADTPLFRMTAGHYIVGRFLIRSDGYSPIPKGVHRIGPRAFERGGLRAAIIPDGVLSIGDNAFANCGILTEVAIPKSVTDIGVDAFAYTPWLTRRHEPFTIAGANILLHANLQTDEVNVPLGVRAIGPAAFAQLPVRRVRLPEGCTRIQHGAFSYCESLEEIDLPSTLRDVDGYVFHNCTSLRNVNFLEGTKKIGHAMFSSCVSLKSVRLPSTITEIENEAFYHSGIEKMIVPDGVTRIGQSAFSHCDNLTDIAIPQSVKEIAENAFTECPKFRIHAEEGSYAERYAKQHPGLMLYVPLSMDEMLALEAAIAPRESEPLPTIPQPAAAPPPPLHNDPDFLFRPVQPQQPAAQPQKPVQPPQQPKIIFIESESTSNIPKRNEEPIAKPEAAPAPVQSHFKATDPFVPTQQADTPADADPFAHLDAPPPVEPFTAMHTPAPASEIAPAQPIQPAPAPVETKIDENASISQAAAPTAVEADEPAAPPQSISAFDALAEQMNFDRAADMQMQSDEPVAEQPKPAEKSADDFWSIDEIAVHESAANAAESATEQAGVDEPEQIPSVPESVADAASEAQFADGLAALENAVNAAESATEQAGVEETAAESKPDENFWSLDDIPAGDEPDAEPEIKSEEGFWSVDDIPAGDEADAEPEIKSEEGFWSVDDIPADDRKKQADTEESVDTADIPSPVPQAAADALLAPMDEPPVVEQKPVTADFFTKIEQGEQRAREPIANMPTLEALDAPSDSQNSQIESIKQKTAQERAADDYKAQERFAGRGNASRTPIAPPTPAVEPPRAQEPHKFAGFEDDEANYAARVKEQLEAARKKSVPVNENTPLPVLPPVAPEPTVEQQKPKKLRKEKVDKAKTAKEKEEAKQRRRVSLLEDLPDLPEDREAAEMRRRQKETPEETKARHRASLLDDLPDLPEERDTKLRANETPEETKARHRAELLDDLPDIPDEPRVPDSAAASADSEDDPFKDIHWNEDQSTFTIRF